MLYKDEEAILTIDDERSLYDYYEYNGTFNVVFDTLRDIEYLKDLYETSVSESLKNFVAEEIRKRRKWYVSFVNDKIKDEDRKQLKADLFGAYNPKLVEKYAEETGLTADQYLEAQYMSFDEEEYREILNTRKPLTNITRNRMIVKRYLNKCNNKEEKVLKLINK